MPEYLKKVYEFFKTNNTAKDVLIGSISFIAGGFVLDRILRRDEDQDEEEEWLLAYYAIGNYAKLFMTDLKILF